MFSHKDFLVGNKDHKFRLKYETLRSLQNRNSNALQLLSDLEADLNHIKYDDQRIQRPVHRLLDETLLMAQELNLLTKNKNTSLYDVNERIRARIHGICRTKKDGKEKPLMVRLDDEQALDANIVGGKAYGVAELKRHLPTSVPDGFVLTTSAYKLFIERNNLVDRIRLLLDDIETIIDREQFQHRTRAIRNLILSANVPEEVVQAIQKEVAATKGVGTTGWAIRSSAISEDGRFSFAGQFDSELKIQPDGFEAAYRSVLASRFSDRAVMYRIHCGFREVSTPMAVLWMPMIDPIAAGIIYTTDPNDPNKDRMVLHAIEGLGNKVVQGTIQPDTFYLSRDRKATPITDDSDANASDYLSHEMLSQTGSTAFQIKEAFGHDMDIEFAIDQNKKLWLLQARRINLTAEETIRVSRQKKNVPVLEQGLTVFPGRAEGKIVHLQPGIDPHSVPKAAIVVVDEPTPEIAAILPNISALLAAQGSPGGHVATLVREFSVPCIFQMGEGIKRLPPDALASVNASNRKVYMGSIWPGVRERVLSRISSTNTHKKSGPLFDLILALNLINPYSSEFKARNCKSVHDTIRYMHERAIQTIFKFGDEQTRFLKKNVARLKSKLPLKLKLIDLGGSLPANKESVEPEEINSECFQALWKGISDPKLSWPDRWAREFMGLPNEFKETVLGGFQGPRKSKDYNYMLIADDYLNFNARFAYHYAMVDAIITSGPENNYILFRLRGGGANFERRDRRVKFLERVLRQSGYTVDRKLDLINAWFRHYPKKETAKTLEHLGRLIVCARQLDVLMRTEADVNRYTDYFLNEQYNLFS